METTVDRIKQYIDYKGFSVRFFEKEVGLSNGSFASQYKNKKTIGVDKVENILRVYVEINPTWLITGDGSMLKKHTINIPDNKNIRHVPQVVTVDSHKKDNIVLVPHKASAGYLGGFNDPEFLEALPSYRMPSIEHGTYRMFQLDGHSMYPTLQDSSYVVCEWVENWENDIKDDRIYVIVSVDEGIVVKRVLNRLNKYGSLYCKSDNRKEYPNLSVKKENIREVWHVKMYMTFDIPNPVDIYDRVNDLEAEVEHLKDLNTKVLDA